MCHIAIEQLDTLVLSFIHSFFVHSFNYFMINELFSLRAYLCVCMLMMVPPKQSKAICVVCMYLYINYNYLCCFFLLRLVFSIQHLIAIQSFVIICLLYYTFNIYFFRLFRQCAHFFHCFSSI